MDAITYSAARANLASTMERVCNDHEALIITRNGEQSVVMLSAGGLPGAGRNRLFAAQPRQRQATAFRRCPAHRRQGNETGTDPVKLIFADAAWEDYLYRQKQDRRMVERINKLIRETQREPFSGVGKPEPLKHALSGFWSRRITDEHRMVYKVEGEALLLAQLRYHY